MNFTWDRQKAAKNLAKHRVDFAEARTVFDDPEAIRIFDPDHSEEEDRYILLGLSVKLRLIVVCHCCHEAYDEVRIISARKAGRKEIFAYTERRNA